jgi:hypothetical protein
MTQKSKLECFFTYFLDILKKSPFFDPKDENFEEKTILFKHISNQWAINCHISTISCFSIDYV